MKLFWLVIFYSASALAEFPYTEAGAGFSDTPGTVHEITPSTPVKAQDGLGLCYGFTATSLLEHHRCRELKSSCQSSEDILSTLDVTSYYEHRQLIEGGHTHRILMNIQDSKLKIAKEECVQFSALVHQIVDDKGKSHKEESVGWRFLIERWNEYRGKGKFTKSNDCVACLAQTIKNTLVSVQTPVDQIKDAFYSASSLHEFLYKSLLPAHCLADSRSASIPPFKVRSFPGHKDTLNINTLGQKVESILLNNMPLEMGICTDVMSNGSCAKNGGHSITLFGIKEVCHRHSGECKKMVKVKNSYGQGWQNHNDNGWVELRELAESSLAMGKYNNISWIEKPGFVLANKSLKNSSSRPVVDWAPISNPAVVPSQYKDHKGIWKCPGSSYKDHYESGCVPMR